MVHSYALGRYTAAAIRASAKAKSELTSQLLLGEPVTVIDPGKTYSKIRCCDDDFEGYMRTDQLLEVDESTFRRQRDNPAFALDPYAILMGDRLGLPVTFGARLPEFDGMRLRHGNQIFSYSGQAALSEDLRTEAELLIRFARRWLYAPELSGGRTPTGVDAAALVQLVARLINIKLPRTAEAMSQHGRMVELVCKMRSLVSRQNEGRTSQKSLQRQIATTDRRIDQLVYELYGLTDEEARLVEEASAI